MHVPNDYWTGSLNGAANGQTAISAGTIDLETLLDRCDLSEVSLVVDIEDSEAELDVIQSRYELLIVEFHSDPSTNDPDDITQAKHRLVDSSLEKIDLEGTVEVHRAPDGGPA